jgi:hypothetical protein
MISWPDDRGMYLWEQFVPLTFAMQESWKNASAKCMCNLARPTHGTLIDVIALSPRWSDEGQICQGRDERKAKNADHDEG